MARYDYGWEMRDRPGFSPWIPGAFWSGAPTMGWAGWEGAGVWGWPPYVPVGYGRYARDFARPRRRPQESPTYGRGGDEAARRFARSHGYDAGYEIRPHFDRPAGRRGRYDRYDRGW